MKDLLIQLPFMSVIKLARRRICQDVVFARDVRTCKPYISFYTPCPYFGTDSITAPGFCTTHFINISYSSGVIREDPDMFPSDCMLKRLQGK